MKKLLFLSLALFCNTTHSQTQEQEKSIRSWFNNYGICKCITDAYWLKGIKIDDKSIHYWNKRMPLSSSNVENIEENISVYIKNHSSKNNLIIKDCILITEDRVFYDLISKFLKSDKILKSQNYNIQKE